MLASLLLNVGANIAGFTGNMDKAARVAEFRSRAIKRSVSREMASVTKILAGAGAAAVGTVSKFANYEQSIKKVGAVSGATETELKKLSETSLKLAAATRFNPTQTTDALYSLSSAGQSVNEQISTLPNVLNLAEAAGADLAQSTELLVSTMAQFDIAASDSVRVADVFTASIGNSSTNVERLQVAMRNAGAIAPAFNQSFEQTIAAVSILTTSFGNGEKAGTGFASALDQLAKNGSKLGINVLDSSGNMKQFVEIVEDLEKAGVTGAQAISVLGKDAGNALATLIKKGSGALRDMESAIQSNGQAAIVAASQLDTLKGDYDQLTSAVDVAILRIGQVSSTNSEARESIQALTRAVNVLADNADILVGAITLGVKAIVALKVARIAAGGVKLLGLELIIAGKSMEAATVRAVALKRALAFVGGPVGVASLAALAIFELGNNYAIFNSKTAETVRVIDNVNKALSKKIDNTSITQIESKYKKAREELEKLNAELLKAQFFDALTEGRTNTAGDIQQSIDRLNLQIIISEKLNTGIAKASTAWEKYSKLLKNGVSRAIDAVNKKGEKQNKIIAETEKQQKERIKRQQEQIRIYEQLGQGFESAIFSLLTPLESLDQQYQQQRDSILKWQQANIGNFEIWQKTEKFLKRQNEQYQKNKKAIEGQLSPFEQLIKSKQAELDLIGKKGPELTKAIAKQELARIGITEATKGQKEYNKYLEELLVLLGKIDQKDTEITFDQKVTGISDLISSIESMSDAFDNFGDDIGRGLQLVSQSFQSALNSIASISSSFGNSSAFESLGKIAGSVSVVGQIAGFVNNLTGGNLFGTSYRTDSTSQNFGIGPGGGFGFVETRESKKRPLFGGTKRRTTISDLASQAQQNIESLFATIENIIATSSLAVGGNLEELISGAFKQTFDKDGNLTGEFSTILGKKYNETFGQFSQRLIAENIIGVLDSVLPQVEHTVTNYIRDFENIEFGAPGIIPVTSTVLTGEANALADRFRDQGAEALLEFANFALKAVEDIQAGNELLSSLTDTTDLIQELGQANETLSQTYERVAGATQLLESSLGIIDTSLDLTREEFVRFAAGIADAAGGLQQASSLWQSYFETFYTEQELLEKRIADATATRDTLLTDLGLDTDITPEAFRQQFEDIFPTLTPEEVTQWLRAGEAIGAVIDLSADITAAAAAAEQALAEEAEANARALSNMMDDIASSIEDLDLSPFAKRLKEISKAFNEQIKTARELGATEQELAMIQSYATRQIEDAIKALESNISTSITDLYGSQLDVINSQIASLEQQQSLSQQLAQASQQRYRDEIAALQNLAGYIDSLFLNPTLTTLNPFEQLQEAQAQFDQLFAQAQSGDASAINALPDIANTLLGLGRDNFASSPAFTALFDTITGQLGSLGLGGPSTVLENINTADPRLLELQTQQRELLSEIANGERFQEVLALANQIAELTSVTDESFASLAERLNLPLDQFLSDLGVNLGDDLTNLTDDTAIAIADVARTLGIEITDLADSVGASLGDLGDTESALNNALEAAIATLPEGVEDSLTGLLRDVENAADGADRLEKLRLMEEYAASLPDDQRQALEPFFNQIDPTSDAQRQLDSMSAINTTNQQMQLGINELRENNARDLNAVQEELIGLRGEFAGLRSELVTLVAQNQS